MKYLLCVPLLSISSVSNDAEATTCSIRRLNISGREWLDKDELNA
jgi:hypothetical protein